MRILHVHSGNQYGGVESVLRVMARASRDPSRLKSVFALSYNGRIAEEIRDAGSDVCILGEVRASRPLSILRARANLLDLFRQRHFDATLAHSAWALSLLAQGVRRPLVFYQHDLFHGRHWTEKLAGYVRPDLILSNSAFTAQTTSEVFPWRQAQVLYPPADLPVKTLSPAERDCLRDRHSTPQSSLVILIAARFEKWKGHQLLLQALASLRHHPHWRLWIAGAPQNAAEREVRESVHQTALRLNLIHRIRFLGHVSDIPALMQSADLYCQPNTGPEPFGLAFVEALAAGLPVVATTLGGVREILEPAWGLLASPQPAAVAQHLERLLNDPDLRRSLGQAGPARARSLCDPDTQIAALASAIASIPQRKAA